MFPSWSRGCICLTRHRNQDTNPCLYLVEGTWISLPRRLLLAGGIAVLVGLWTVCCEFSQIFLVTDHNYPKTLCVIWWAIWKEEVVFPLFSTFPLVQAFCGSVFKVQHSLDLLVSWFNSPSGKKLLALQDKKCAFCLVSSWRGPTSSRASTW